MNYDIVKQFYPIAAQISKVLYNNDCGFKISSRSIILYKDRKEVVIIPVIQESSLTLSSMGTNYIDKEPLDTIDADLWFNLSIQLTLPFSYDCIDKLKSIHGNFHITMSIQNEG